MSLRRPLTGAVRSRPWPLACALLAALVIAPALVLAGALPWPGTTRAAAQSSGEEATPTPQTDASIPAGDVTMIGATPEEAGAPGADETWGVGTARAGSGTNGTVIVRYTSEGGWALGPELQDAAGQPLSGFILDKSPLAGQMTPHGAGVLIGTVGQGPAPPPTLLVRNPGGSFRETSPVPAEGETLNEGEEPLLHKGEALLSSSRAPLIAALDEQGGEAGALVVPVVLGEGPHVENQVLHWDGKHWASETVDVPEPSHEEFRVLAIGASSPGNAWLLAQLSAKASYPKGAVALFRRVTAPEEPGHWQWEPVELTAGSSEERPLALTAPVRESKDVPYTVAGLGGPPSTISQILTVTSEGVWIDGERADVHAGPLATTTMFFKPQANEGKGALLGKVEGSWCQALSEGAPPCGGELPEALPSGPARSIAWANGTRFGERVITGLLGGVTLRLDGESFTPVLSLGAGVDLEEDPGASFGAAFSKPDEGWLGTVTLPIHLTTSPAASKLTSWPVSFRHPLLAIAPQPGAPVGALSSEALAVGDLGAVARYKPGVGWLPESLFGPGERVETPRLRAVAWPTPQRAYAVGDLGEMWLWRGETGLWEHDPATPLNFRGNLLGVAFEPSNPAIGYAVGSNAVVGSGGVLLRYGKTWTQETGLPSEVQNANFTAITFAGSEAIVAYRTRPSIFSNNQAGGLLVNDGSGWQVDQEAATLIGSGVPGAVAGLPDGGAAFTAIGEGGTRVYEREAPGRPWQATPVAPLSEFDGALALFREGGALRAVVSDAGGVANASEPQAPAPGFPPSFLPPLSPAGSDRDGGDLLRQTSSGWSDEDHELDPIGEPSGHYASYDLPYRPDAVQDVLIDPTGTQGWAVGGNINGVNERLETADIERYPADGVTPLGMGGSQVALNPGAATFAIGGGAQCAAPCADRFRAGIGPDVWLETALARAKQIGARAFLYTGPHVTTGATNGVKSEVIGFAQEFAGYANILASAALPAYAALSPQDIDARPEVNGDEAQFERAFEGLPAPFGAGAPAPALGEAPEGRLLEGGEHKRERCLAEIGCQAGYYAIDSEGSGGTVRVIVLDDSADVGATQLAWLEGQLAGAAAAQTPAIVVGNADLNTQIAAGDKQAVEVARALGASSGCASAYFYDAPEANVTEPVRGASCGSQAIPTFGSGTLGYVSVISEARGDFHGASGFLLGEVDVAARNASTNFAPVASRLVPNIGELALEAKDGILLRRSEPALFTGLARRPRAGGRASTAEQNNEIDPYIPIPENCVGSVCEHEALLPAYTFSSSDEEVGQFVAPNLESTESHAVLQGPDGKPIPDAQSGLFCAYNPGTTTVTISAGGLSSSLLVTVQPGSVRQPCGTVPLKNLPARPQALPVPAPPPPTPAPAPTGPAPTPAPLALLLPPPPATPTLPPPARQTPAPPPLPFLPLPALAAPVIPFVPPPVPTPARPTPPSGTSAVTSPIEIAEHEEEEESATESVSNQAVVYRSAEHEPMPAYILGIVVLAALAGASIRRPRRGRREVRLAPATLSGARGQRRMSGRGRADR